MTPSSMADDSGADNTPRIEVVVPAQTGLPPENGRLGVLGSAYNPITRAHLLLARFAREQFQLNEVIFVLPKILPNKPLVGVSLEQRLEMMQLAARDDVPYISIGLCSHGLFLEICTALEQHYPQRPEIFFITGRDAAERILTWPYDDPAASLAQMFACFQLLVYEREGKLELPDKPLIQQYSNYIHILDTEQSLDHISSTEVRRRVRADLPIDDLVPPAVANFIETSNIYKDIAKK